MADSWVVEQFEENRGRLRNVAYRILGSEAEAEDAVQEAWVRLSRSDTRSVESLAAWLTTVVSRVCLDMLRSRQARREDPIGDVEVVAPPDPGALDPEEELILADSVGLALLIVLDTLSPAERVAFVLHDMFDIPFDEVGSVVGRSPMAARQLASRARRRVRAVSRVPEADFNRQRQVVEAFLSASRAGDFESLLQLLDPAVVLRADELAVRQASAKLEAGAPKLEAEVRGATAVANVFSGRARAAEPALIDGTWGLAWAPGGTPRAVFRFTLAGGRIVAMELVGDPETIRHMDVAVA